MLEIFLIKISELPFHFVFNIEQNLNFVTLPSILMLISVIVFQSSSTTLKKTLYTKPGD